MEEENKQEVQQEINQGKKLNFKKYLPIIGGAVVIIVIAIVLILTLGGGPKKAVKTFISAMDKQNASKMLKSIDFIGSEIWWNYDEEDFSEEDYEKFVEEYNGYLETYEELHDEKVDDIKEIVEELQEDYEDDLDDMFDDMKDEYKSIKFKLEEFKSTEKLGKDLYLVKAKITLEAIPEDEEETEEIDKTDTADFVVYKNKIIYSDLM